MPALQRACAINDALRDACRAFLGQANAARRAALFPMANLLNVFTPARNGAPCVISVSPIVALSHSCHCQHFCASKLNEICSNLLQEQVLRCVPSEVDWQGQVAARKASSSHSDYSRPCSRFDRQTCAGTRSLRFVDCSFKVRP